MKRRATGVINLSVPDLAVLRSRKQLGDQAVVFGRLQRREFSMAAGDVVCAFGLVGRFVGDAMLAKLFARPLATVSVAGDLA